MRQGFDNDMYIASQAEHIKERIAQFGGKLYLEFGGKLFDDYHASRVLPGFEPDSKVRMLMSLADDAEVIIAINANHIEGNKHRSDIGIALFRGRFCASWTSTARWACSWRCRHYAFHRPAPRRGLSAPPGGHEHQMLPSLHH